MPQEGEEDDGEDHDGVVHGVVGEVGAHPEVGVGEARRQAQGVRVRELRHGRRVASAVAPGLGAGEEVERRPAAAAEWERGGAAPRRRRRWGLCRTSTWEMVGGGGGGSDPGGEGEGGDREEEDEWGKEEGDRGEMSRTNWRASSGTTRERDSRGGSGWQPSPVLFSTLCPPKKY